MSPRVSARLRFRDWALILRLAERLNQENPTLDRQTFLRVALQVWSEELEAVIGSDLRD